MTVESFTFFAFLGSFAAGLLGALTGLGGGVVLVPLLTLAMGVEVHYAMGASLIAVMATSSIAAAAFLEKGFVNLRIGMLLETGAALGALGGATLATVLPARVLIFAFALMLLYSAATSWRSPAKREPEPAADAPPGRLRLVGTFPTASGPRRYRARNVVAGWIVTVFAGALSGMLGIGSGALKVLVHEKIMHLPYKVSTTTSNFIIGLTATASAGVYLHKGYVDPQITAPVMLGVLAGAALGARIFIGASSRYLRPIFAVVLLAAGVEMTIRGLGGG